MDDDSNSPATITLDHLGLAYGPPDNEDQTQSSHPLDTRFFRTAGDPVTGEDLEPLYGSNWRWQSRVRVAGESPTLRVALTVDTDETFALLDGHVFDTQTRAQVSHRTFAFQRQDRLATLDTGIRLWRPTPVVVVVDLAMGPMHVKEIPPGQSTTLQFPHGTLRYLGLVSEARGTRSSSRSGPGGSSMTVTFGGQNSGGPSRHPLTMVVFGSPEPQANGLFQIEVLNADGDVLEHRGGSSSQHFFGRHVAGRPEDVATIHVRQYSRFIRCVFRLPEIPGLPEANQGLTNMFDQRIPYLAADSARELGRHLEGLLQLTIDQYRVAPNAAGFPMAWSNTTARALFEAYRGYYPTNYQVFYDPEAGTVEFVDNSLRARFGRFLRRVF